GSLTIASYADKGVMSDPTPSELMRALLAGNATARACLELWCRGPIDRLLERVVERRLSQDREVLVGRTLRWAEMYLRSREPSTFSGMSRGAFIAEVCAAAYRVLSPTAPGSDRGGDVASQARGARMPDHVSQTESCAYRLRSLSRPLEDVGGDWCL